MLMFTKLTKLIIGSFLNLKFDYMNFKIYLSVIFYSIFLFINISAQTINLNGKLTSQPNNIPLPNAIITFYDAADTTNNLGSVTSDANGLFSKFLTDVEDIMNTNVSSKLNVSFSGKRSNIISFEISNSKSKKVTANIYSPFLLDNLSTHLL